MNILKCPDYLEMDEKEKANFECVYPYYGIAPHYYDKSNDAGVSIRKFLPKEKWQKNFHEDLDGKGMGVYVCPFDQACSKEQL